MSAGRSPFPNTDPQGANPSFEVTLKRRVQQHVVREIAGGRLDQRRIADAQSVRPVWF